MMTPIFFPIFPLLAAGVSAVAARNDTCTPSCGDGNAGCNFGCRAAMHLGDAHVRAAEAFGSRLQATAEAFGSHLQATAETFGLRANTFLIGCFYAAGKLFDHHHYGLAGGMIALGAIFAIVTHPKLLKRLGA